MSRVINDSDEEKNHKGIKCETESEFGQAGPTKKYSLNHICVIRIVHYLFW